MKRFIPPTVATIVAAGFVVWRLISYDWNPVELFELTTPFAQGEPTGSDGYDGQFTYFIAIQPRPELVADRLDVPAYRYQRILYPIASRLLALGNEQWIPWSMILLNLVAHWIGTWTVGRLLRQRQVSEWYALSYGLWVGLIAPIGIGLSEPIAYGLVALGLLARQSRSAAAGPLILGLAVFAKETALVFLAAALLAELFGRRDRTALAVYAVVILSIVGWQAWLLAQFGAIGLGSGGAMATGFELIPFMGLLRIGTVSMRALWLFLGILGPSIVLPTLWGAVTSARDLLRRNWELEPWLLFSNAVSIMLLPFSTFREPLGVVRFADGLVLSLLLYAATYRPGRPLRYSLLWSAMLAMLIPQ